MIAKTDGMVVRMAKKYIVEVKEVTSVVNLATDRKLIVKNLRFWFRTSKPVKVIAEGVVKCDVKNWLFRIGELGIANIEVNSELWELEGKKAKLILEVRE